MIYLLDTDVFNHFHAGHPRVRARASAVGASNLATTLITRIEVLRGRFEFVLKAATSNDLNRAMARLDESDSALSRWKIVSFNEAALQHFDRLRIDRSLRKIGRADLLIACIALAHRATLASRNVRDFSLVPGLMVDNWVD